MFKHSILINIKFFYMFINILTYTLYSTVYAHIYVNIYSKYICIWYLHIYIYFK
jgi:hypothetical protein